VYASFGLPVAATAMLAGNDVPSSMRMDVPRSKSAAISRGILAWLLQRVHQHRRRVHLAAIDCRGAILAFEWRMNRCAFLDIEQKFAIFGTLGGHERAIGPDGEDLPDLFVERHLFQGLRTQRFGVGRKLRRGKRSGSARRFLCLARSSHGKKSEQQEPAI